MIDKQKFTAIFKELQKQFIVSGMDCSLSNFINGKYDFPTMCKGEITPPDDVIFFDLYANIYEKPMKLDGNIIKSKKYYINALFPNNFSVTEAVTALKRDYQSQKDAENKDKGDE